MDSMQRALVGVLPLLASCMFIVPADKRAVVNEQDRWNAPMPVGEPQLALAQEVRDTSLVLQGTWRRTCEQSGSHVKTLRISREAKFKVWVCGGDKSCEVMLLVGIFAAPVTLLVSGLITAVDVRGADDRTEEQVSALAPHRAACDLPAKGWNLVVTAPGRAPIPVTTDERGVARVELGDAQLARAATVAPATPRPILRASTP
jgi:hypothetical protein